ncbi:hypothetical protein [Halorientalis marina]|jgi:hypothetical protein|uniref:hypothetical protein n=1 Tax=Halorientalis marina TaxID=2931976 RepID=UPI001FF4CBF5|nr:hypothetical protein [Halorientalis marina]
MTGLTKQTRGFQLALRGNRQRTGEPLGISLGMIDEKEGATVVVPIITTAPRVRVKTRPGFALAEEGHCDQPVERGRNHRDRT